MSASPSNRERIVPIFLGQCVGLLCGIIGVRITSQLVPADVFGRYGIFLTFTPLGMWVVHVGLVKFTARHWAAAPDRAALWRAIVRAGARKTSWLLLATGAAAIACAGPDWWRVWPLLALATALLSWATLAQTALQAGREHWRDAAVVTAAAVTRSFTPPLLYAATGSLFALYAGFSFHALVFALAGWWALRPHLRSTSAAAPMTLPAVYDGPLFVALAISNWALLGLNRWIMAAHFGAHETGYFSLATNLAALVPSVLATIILQYLQPGFFALETASAQDRRALWQHVDRAALQHAALALAGLAALRGIAPWLVGPLIRESYRPALDYLIPAGCFALATSTALFFHTALLAGRRERACGPVDLTTAAVLTAGGLVAAQTGETWFLRWLCVAPAIPWMLTRPMARRYFLKPDEAATPAPAR